MCRAYATEETTKKFIDQIKMYIDEWVNIDERDTRGKLEGLAFCILNILDGTTGLPAFLVVPMPHESDEKHHRENGDNFYPRPDNDTVDAIEKFALDYPMHDMFYE